MTKIDTHALILIVILIGGFVITDYQILQSQDLSASIVPPLASTPPDDTSISSPTCDLKQYKLLENVDECKLNSYTKKGWAIFQVGSIVEQTGRAVDCTTISQLNIDWVVLQKSSISSACF